MNFNELKKMLSRLNYVEREIENLNYVSHLVDIDEAKRKLTEENYHLLSRLPFSDTGVAEYVLKIMKNSGKKSMESSNLNIHTILDLAAGNAAGLPDPKSFEKLIDENQEFRDTPEDDKIGQALELADVIYYASKDWDFKARIVGVSINQAISIALIKYRFRADNPKNDREERKLVEVFLGGTL